MGGNFLVAKKEAKITLKKSLIFREMELSGPKLKRFLIFLEETSKATKTKMYYTSPRNSYEKFFQKHFRIFVSIFSKNWILQYYLYIKTLQGFLCVESFFSFQIFFMIYKVTIIFLIILLTFSQIVIYSSINFHLLS